LEDVIIKVSDQVGRTMLPVVGPSLAVWQRRVHGRHVPLFIFLLVIFLHHRWQGGGIRRSGLHKVWNYLYTTYPESFAGFATEDSPDFRWAWSMWSACP
jgi:hypothetical protein